MDNRSEGSLVRDVVHEEKLRRHDIVLSNKKKNKPLIEKRRRARINECLAQLKEIIIKEQNMDCVRSNRLEKADILEMTVDYVRKLHVKGEAVPSLQNAYELGIERCITEMAGFMAIKNDVISGATTQNLINHCRNLLRQNAENRDVTATGRKTCYTSCRDKVQTQADSSTSPKRPKLEDDPDQEHFSDEGTTLQQNNLESLADIKQLTTSSPDGLASGITKKTINQIPLALSQPLLVTSGTPCTTPSLPECSAATTERKPVILTCPGNILIVLDNNALLPQNPHPTVTATLATPSSPPVVLTQASAAASSSVPVIIKSESPAIVPINSHTKLEANQQCLTTGLYGSSITTPAYVQNASSFPPVSTLSLNQPLDNNIECHIAAISAQPESVGNVSSVNTNVTYISPSKIISSLPIPISPQKIPFHDQSIPASSQIPETHRPDIEFTDVTTEKLSSCSSPTSGTEGFIPVSPSTISMLGRTQFNSQVDDSHGSVPQSDKTDILFDSLTNQMSGNEPIPSVASSFDPLCMAPITSEAQISSHSPHSDVSSLTSVDTDDSEAVENFHTTDMQREDNRVALTLPEDCSMYSTSSPPVNTTTTNLSNVSTCTSRRSQQHSAHYRHWQPLNYGHFNDCVSNCGTDRWTKISTHPQTLVSMTGSNHFTKNPTFTIRHDNASYYHYNHVQDQVLDLSSKTTYRQELPEGQGHYSGIDFNNNNNNTNRNSGMTFILRSASASSDDDNDVTSWRSSDVSMDENSSSSSSSGLAAPDLRETRTPDTRPYALRDGCMWRPWKPNQ